MGLGANIRFFLSPVYEQLQNKKKKTNVQFPSSSPSTSAWETIKVIREQKKQRGLGYIYLQPQIPAFHHDSTKRNGINGARNKTKQIPNDGRFRLSARIGQNGISRGSRLPVSSAVLAKIPLALPSHRPRTSHTSRHPAMSPSLVVHEMWSIHRLDRQHPIVQAEREILVQPVDGRFIRRRVGPRAPRHIRLLRDRAGGYLLPEVAVDGGDHGR